MKSGRFEVTQKLLVWRGGSLLVLRDRASGEGDLPGGRMGEHELLAPWVHALRREVAEELGAGFHVAIGDAPVLAFPHRLPSTGAPAVGLLWVGTWEAGEVVLSEEHDAFLWADPAALPWLSGTLGDAVRDWLAR